VKPWTAGIVHAILCGALWVSACHRLDTVNGPAVRFETADGVVLSGWYHPPATSRRLTCVLIHGLGSTRGEWDPLIQRLAASGFGVLAYDQRGHGASTATATGVRVSWRAFGPPGPGSSWEKLSFDVSAAVSFLSRRGVARDTIVLIGASIGSSAAVLYAARDRRIPGVVLLSPGWEYQGLLLRDALPRLVGRRIAVVVSTGDEYSRRTVDAVVRMLQTAGRTPVVREMPGDAHGVHLLDEPTTEWLLEWLSGVDR